ncbi:MAG: isopentenyl-diphosphate Delta-isomerase [bacterium]
MKLFKVDKNLMQTKLILVNEQDQIVGEAEKFEVHKNGLLHRAFSIVIFNSKKEMLLQKRAPQKYHSGGLWTNACCSHPRINENLETAIHKRLYEEMGFDCPLDKKSEFIYKVWIDKQQFFEYEYDHIFVGKYDGEIKPNQEEVCEFKWVDMQKLKADVQKHPYEYTYWFREIIEKFGW